MMQKPRKPRAGFSVVSYSDTRKIVWITDDFSFDKPTMSVTNDAEAVVESVNASYGGYRIICRDTSGDWDELCHANGRFTGFASARDVLPAELVLDSLPPPGAP